MSPTRVLIVDSMTARERLVEALANDPAFEVVGQIGDGALAPSTCEARQPDVVSLGVLLPTISAVEVAQRIMNRRPTPILVLSPSPDRGDGFRTLDALRAGAVEVFDTARLEGTGDWVADYKATLRLVSRIPLFTRRANAPNRREPTSSSDTTTGIQQLREGCLVERPAKSNQPDSLRDASVVLRDAATFRRRLVVLGASTGGPAALACILSKLPRDFALPILVVLHMSPVFTATLVEWLGRSSLLRVRLAIDGEPLPIPGAPSSVILAPPDRHLVIDAGRLRLTSESERFSCRPSIDVLFESAAKELGPCVVGGVLTGMGKDGAKGLLDLRRSGAFTMAQDESTSAVFGMPREAIGLGAAEQTLPIDAIAEVLTRLASAPVDRSMLP